MAQATGPVAGRAREAAVLRRLGRGLLGLALLTAIAAAGILALSEWELRRVHDRPLVPFTAEPSAGNTAEGRRLAILIGCLEGCHGPEGEGGDEGAERIFYATAPPLGAVVPRYGDAELARLVRFGVKRDGRTAIGMPAGTFFPIADADLALVVAHLRTLPAVDEGPRERRVEPLGRLALVLGKWRTSAGEVDPARPRWGELPRETPYERGRYWASIVCAECHGFDFRGNDVLGSPPLTVARAYDRERFGRLLRFGELLNGNNDGLMGRVARAAFDDFREEEVDDLYAFLRTLRPPGEQAPELD